KLQSGAVYNPWVFFLLYFLLARRRALESNSALLRRTATVMRNGREILDDSHFQARRRERAHRRFPSRPGTAYFHIHCPQPRLLRLIGSGERSLLRREGRALARSPEPQRTRARPRQHVPHGVSDSDDGVVERRLHVDHAHGDHLLFLLLEGLLLAAFGRCLRWCFGRHVLSSALSLGLRAGFLLVRHGAAPRTLAGASVGMRALSPHRQAAAMPHSAIRTHLDQALDVHRDLFAEIPFHGA